MSSRATATLASVLVIGVALGGCTNPDAPGAGSTASTPSTPGSAGEPPPPPPPSPTSQAPFGVQPTPQRALRQYAARYINWTYQTLTADQRTLAAMAVASARLSEQQAAARSVADTTITRGHVWNKGQVVSVGSDLARAGTWLVVTREQTGGNTEYEGLPAGYHVTLAKLASVAGGYAVSEWLPQS